jgi:CubicO group peptidase (beta-lactamase class C family)
MNRRRFLAGTAAAAFARPFQEPAGRFEAAAEILGEAVRAGRLRAAALAVRHPSGALDRAFGAAAVDAPFLLASITKTLAAAALMTLFDRGAFGLDDPVVRHLPGFSEGPRARITVRQLLTHVSGLPDQLPENAELRRRHAGLDAFVQGALRTPLLFAPGTRYSYSSMGILLASEIARRLSGKELPVLLDESVFRPLGMTRSVLGLGRFRLEDVVLNQVERAAPESGAGDSGAKDWDWNSPYWRALGAPWGTAHGSASDVARFLSGFLRPDGRWLKAETVASMIRNHNPEGLAPRGLGFALGKGTAGARCSVRTFGHTGSTGTICWADPATETVCVVLTTLPAGAASPHPRQTASDRVAEAAS